ncbi:MAG: YfhO family protein [Coriobacteriia bacterium]|nr:YfhO family protein [Coriobacteriia bacterium]
MRSVPTEHDAVANDLTDSQGVRAGRLERALDAVLAWARRCLQTRRGYALLFLLLFALAWLPVLFTVLASGKSLIWQVDGLSQQYVWFVYTGQWVRELLSNIFITHTFALPMWTMDAGYGTDIIQAYSGTFVNPFYLVSALVPERFAEFAFEAVMLLMLYCAGLAFSLWARGRGASPAGTLLGAVAYVFAGNAVVVFSQPSFIVSMVTFPLVLRGADLVFERRSPALFLAVLAWEFAASFYDAYMICILLVLYCLVRFFFGVERGVPRHGRALRLLKWVGIFVGYVMLALLAGCVLLLPQVMSLMGADRLGVTRSDDLLYALSVYERFFVRFIGAADLGSDAYSGFNALSALAFVLLLARWRKHKGLALSFVVLTIMMLVPAFGRLMNGLEYATDRWSWAYGLLGAYAIAKLLPELLSTSRHERRVLALVVALYGVACFALPLPSADLSFAATFVVLVCSVAVVLSASSWPRPRALAALTCCVVLSGVVTFVTLLSPYYGGRAWTLMGFNRLWEFHSTNAVARFVGDAQAAGATYDETYRYDRTTPVASGVHNSGLITGLMTPDYYNSIYSQGIDDLNTSLGLVDTEGTNFRYGGLNSRAMLEGLLGVRYYYVDDEHAAMVPETFADATTIAEGPGREDHYRLLEADVVAPLAFVADSYLTRAQYEALPMADRQRALLAGVVLEGDDEATGLENVGDEVASGRDGIGAAQEIPYEIASASGCDVDEAGTSVTVRRAGACLTLTFNAPGDAETYLYTSGLTYEDISYRERATDAEWAAKGFIGRLKTLLAEPFRAEVTNGTIVASAPGAASTIYQMNANDHMYGGKHEWLANVGYDDEGRAQLTLTFTQPGIYSFDEMSVVSQPMAGVDERIGELAAAGARDITLGTNEISCTASSDTDAQLFLSVAYSDGWSATVDGQPAAIHKADLGFMSVELPAGTHEVRLTYVTPYLREGAVLSALGIVGCVVTCVLVGRHHRRTAGERAA